MRNALPVTYSRFVGNSETNIFKCLFIIRLKYHRERKAH